MKVEFNKNVFAADISGSEAVRNHKTSKNDDLLKDKISFLLSLIALGIAVASLPLGLIINLGIDFLSEFLNTAITHLVAILFFLSTVMICLAVLCGVFSVVCYAKSKKQFIDNIGLALAILSFAVSLTCFVFSIFGLLAW